MRPKRSSRRPALAGFLFSGSEIARLRWCGYRSWLKTGLMATSRQAMTLSRRLIPAAPRRAMDRRPTRLAPVQGYPEDGKHAWRAGNDDTIVAAVDKYNSEHQYQPGDAEYMTPQLMKAWMMQESGSMFR